MEERAGIRALPLGGICALAVLVLLIWVVPESAQAGSVVGPGGQISSCYKKKGKGKGTLRVIPSGKRCRKGEKKLTWNAQGPQGQSGGQGGTGTPGGTGESGLQSQITQLKEQITQLTSQVTQLTSQLTQAVADVSSLCGQVGTLTTQANNTLTGVGAPNLTGTVLSLGSLGLTFPSLPSSLSPYTCP